MAINFQLIAFCTAQKIDKPFGVSNIVSIVICACITGWLVNGLQVGIHVFSICKVIIELSNLGAILYSLIYCIEKDSLVKISLKDVFSNDFMGFLKFGFKMIFALYAEFIGFEINTYMAGITHDQDQISAFVSWVNFTNIVFAIGLGLGNVSRINISNYVGEKRFVEAKNLTTFYVFACSVIGIIFFIVILLLKHSISSIYTNLPGVTYWLDTIFMYYSIGAFVEIMMGTLCTIMRISNRTGQVIILVIICFMLQLPIQSYVFCFILGGGVVGLVVSFILSSVTINSLYAYFIFKHIDWKDVSLEAN